MKPIKELYEEHGSDLKNLLLKDPKFFINNIINQFKLTDYQEEFVDIIHNNQRSNLCAFRTSGKTEICFIDYPIYLAYTKPRQHIILISKSLPQSTELIKRIKEKIYFSEVLRTAIPSNRTASWSKTEIELKNGSRISCKPYNENIRGYHVNFCGCDEIGEYKDQNIFHRSIVPTTIAHNGKIAVAGTPTSDIDLIHELQKNPAYKNVIYPVWTNERNYFEERYPGWKIRKEKGRYNIYNNHDELFDSYDVFSFSRELLCKPLSEDDRLFPYSLLKDSFNENLGFETKRDPGRDGYYIGADFAMSANTGADFTCFCVGRYINGKKRLVKMERYKGLGYIAQKARLRNLNELFRPVELLVDKKSFGEAFIQDLRSEKIPIKGFNFDAGPKQEAVASLRGDFEDNKIELPRATNDLNTKLKIDVLIKELMSYGVKYDSVKKSIKLEGIGSHDDTVDAFSLMCFAMRHRGFSNYAISRGNKRRSNNAMMSRT